MRILRYELKKLFSYKSFLFIIASALVMSIVSTLWDITSRHASPDEYRQIYSAIQSMSEEEAEAYITQQVDIAFSGEGGFSPDAICSARDHYAQIKGYGEFLDSIKERCRSITGISFFADEDSFAFKNALKTETVYDNVKINSLPFEVSEGVEIALFNNISDILLVFAIFASAVFVFTKDKEIGILNLLHSYRKGRESLCINKLLVLLIFSALANLVFMGANLAIGGFTYGLGDLIRPIQSVNGFFECSFNLSLWQYLLIMFIFKSLGGFLWGVLFAFICSFAGNNAQIYGISVIIAVAEVLLYTKISTLSNYGLLHDFNLVSYIKPDNIFSTYRNINLFNEPFNTLIVIPVVWIILIVPLIFAVVKTFAGEKNIEYRKISLGIRKKTAKHKVHSKLYYTFHKSLVLQKTGYLVAIWLAAVMIFHLSFTKPVDLTDYYYKDYTTDNSGAVTAQTDEVIRIDEEYFATLHEELMSPDTTIERMQEIQGELQREGALFMFRSRCEAIRDNKYDTEIFYDSGYKRAFDVDGNTESKQMALLIMIFSALAISPLISFDRSRGLTSVIYSTASGKKSYLNHSIIVTVTLSIFASIAVMFPYFFNILSKYGTQGIVLPVQSLEHFADLALPLNICQYALGLFLVRTMIFTLCSLAMLLVSRHSKSRFSATLINVTVFIMPVLIIVVG